MKCFSSCLDSKKGITENWNTELQFKEGLLFILSLNLSHACHKNTFHQVHLQPLLIFVFCGDKLYFYPALLSSGHKCATFPD